MEAVELRLRDRVQALEELVAALEGRRLHQQEEITNLIRRVKYFKGRLNQVEEQLCEARRSNHLLRQHVAKLLKERT